MKLNVIDVDDNDKDDGDMDEDNTQDGDYDSVLIIMQAKMLWHICPYTRQVPPLVTSMHTS